MRSNPPIKGHELLYEGHGKTTIDPVTDDYSRREDGSVRVFGGCRCGVRPDGWPDLSVGAVKRWHRLHKDEIRLAAVRAVRERGRR